MSDDREGAAEWDLLITREVEHACKQEWHRREKGHCQHRIGSLYEGPVLSPLWNHQSNRRGRDCQPLCVYRASRLSKVRWSVKIVPRARHTLPSASYWDV